MLALRHADVVQADSSPPFVPRSASHHRDANPGAWRNTLGGAEHPRTQRPQRHRQGLRASGARIPRDRRQPPTHWQALDSEEGARSAPSAAFWSVATCRPQKVKARPRKNSSGEPGLCRGCEDACRAIATPDVARTSRFPTAPSRSPPARVPPRRARPPRPAAPHPWRARS